MHSNDKYTTLAWKHLKKHTSKGGQADRDLTEWRGNRSHHVATLAAAARRGVYESNQHYNGKGRHDNERKKYVCIRNQECEN